MRIPRDKLYRAFPELDDFTDEQCLRFLQRIRITSSYYAWLVMSVITTIVIGLIVGSAVVAGVQDGLDRVVREELGRHVADHVITGAWLLVFLGTPGFSWLLARDLVLRFHLRRVMHERIDRTRCRQCRYVLLGQRVVGTLVTCPECGHRMTLHILGVTAEDLVPPKSAHDLMRG